MENAVAKETEDNALRLQKQMAVLVKINNLTGFLPMKLDNLLQAIIKEMNQVFSPFECELHLIHENHLESCCNLLEGHSCRAMEDQLPLITEQGENLCCQSETCIRKFRLHICVPIISGIEKFGVVTLKSKQDDEFDRDSMELLLAIVNLIAAAIQRSRLIQRLEQERDNLEKANTSINDLNKELQNSIDQLKKTREQLIISERLASAGQLSANLAHEINNPIGVILSRLELILLDAEDQGLPRTVIEDLEVIKKHTERITSITRGLLSFSRQSTAGLEAIDLNSIVLEITDWLRSQFERKKIKFQVNLQPLPKVSGNAQQIEQVLVNLLNNAKDAMPQGGEIRIESRYDAQNQWNQLDVIDDGIGISKEIKNHIFDPFFTTKGKNYGTGLGLSISYRLIENFGGRIKVESEPGKGSCFSILLPVLRDGGEVSDNAQGTENSCH